MLQRTIRSAKCSSVLSITTFPTASSVLFKPQLLMLISCAGVGVNNVSGGLHRSDGSGRFLPETEIEAQTVMIIK